MYQHLSSCNQRQVHLYYNVPFLLAYVSIGLTYSAFHYSFHRYQAHRCYSFPVLLSFVLIRLTKLQLSSPLVITITVTYSTFLVLVLSVSSSGLEILLASSPPFIVSDTNIAFQSYLHLNRHQVHRYYNCPVLSSIPTAGSLVTAF